MKHHDFFSSYGVFRNDNISAYYRNVVLSYRNTNEWSIVDKVFVLDRVTERHPDVSKDDARFAWEHVKRSMPSSAPSRPSSSASV